jgi:hypothetical protein
MNIVKRSYEVLSHILCVPARWIITIAADFPKFRNFHTWLDILKANMKPLDQVAFNPADKSQIHRPSGIITHF